VTKLCYEICNDTSGFCYTILSQRGWKHANTLEKFKIPHNNATTTQHQTIVSPKGSRLCALLFFYHWKLLLSFRVKRTNGRLVLLLVCAEMMRREMQREVDRHRPSSHVFRLTQKATLFHHDSDCCVATLFHHGSNCCVMSTVECSFVLVMILVSSSSSSWSCTSWWLVVEFRVGVVLKRRARVYSQ
jgi:hypothetical protein